MNNIYFRNVNYKILSFIKYIFNIVYNFYNIFIFIIFYFMKFINNTLI